MNSTFLIFFALHICQILRDFVWKQDGYVLLRLVTHGKLLFTKNDLLFQIVALFRTRDQHQPPRNRQDFHGRNLVRSKWLVVHTILSAKKIWHFSKKLQPQNMWIDCQWAWTWTCHCSRHDRGKTVATKNLMWTLSTPKLDTPKS